VNNDTKATAVRVADVDMPFLSMVVFMVKWALASIPALMILGCMAFLYFACLVSVGAGALGAFK
jgi:hypothetical protein